MSNFLDSEANGLGQTSTDPVMAAINDEESIEGIWLGNATKFSAETADIDIEGAMSTVGEDLLLVPQNAPEVLNLVKDGSELGKDPLTGETDDATVGEADTLTGGNTDEVEIETRARRKRDTAGNNLKKARNLGVLTDDERFREFVGKSDRKDFYKFRVKEKTDVDIELRGLSGNADVYLLNNKGKVLGKSARGGKRAEAIERTLNPGSYYVRVQPKNKKANADYTLSLNAELPDVAGNTPGKAHNLGVLKDEENFQEFVGKSDGKDFYKFKVKEKTDVDIELRGLSGNADVYLLNNKRKVIGKSAKGGKGAEDIERTLNPGSYYVRVQPKNKKVNADYTLSLETTPGAETLEKYEFTYYYGGSQGDRFQDYYSGYVYAPKGTYKVRSYYDFKSKKNEAGANGKYYISSSSSAGAKAKDGEIYLKSYYDVENDRHYTPYYASGGFASGTSGLGSEEDFIGAEFDSEEDAVALSPKAFFGADNYVADIAPEARTSKSGDYQTDALLSSYKWGTDRITYSFYDDSNAGQYYGNETGVKEVSEKVKENVRDILENIYEPLLNVDFVEIPDTSNNYGLIRIMKSDGPDYAYARYPKGDDVNKGNILDIYGDIHLNPDRDGAGGINNFQGGPGTHGYLTLIHELGHAVGLKHPGDYNGDGKGTPPFLPSEEDNTENTVMSYNFDFKADTLMSYDVKALQYIYGAESLKGSITLNSPNGGNTLEPGSSYTITWSDNIAENVKLELYKGGSLSSAIASSTESGGSYLWTVPASITSGSDYQVKVTSVSDSSVSDLSNSNFTIKPEDVITVTSPNGGNTLEPGSSYNITWSDNITENVKLELYKGGSLSSAIASSTESDGSYVWTVPASITSGSDYQVKVTSVSDSSVSDLSNSNFTIKPEDVITVTSPNGGNTLEPGSSYNITWSDNITENVKLELYKGGSLSSAIASSTESDGSYVWTVPASITSGSDYQVKVTSVSDSSVSDLSDSSFTIKPEDVITVTSPNGGNTLEAGESYTITWNDSIDENVKIELLLLISDTVSISSDITSSTSSDGSYTWTVPETVTGIADGSSEYKIQITSVGDSSVSDLSDSSFTIEPAASELPAIAWTKLLGSSELESSSALTTDSDGSIYVSGFTEGNLDGIANSGDRDGYIAKYLPDGTKAWTKMLGSTESDSARALTADSDGSIYVGGWTYGNLDGQTNSDDSNGFIAKYLPDGSKLWSKFLGTDLSAEDLSMASDGSIYVAGSRGTFRSFISKYLPDGTEVWTEDVGVSSQRGVEAITTGSDGSIYIGGFTSTISSASDGFIRKYLPDGTEAWTKLLGTSGYDGVTTVATGNDGSIYVGGWTEGSLDGQTYNGGHHDAFIAKYLPDGTKAWTKLLGSSGSDDGEALTIGSDGSIYLSGVTGGNLDGQTKSGSSDIFVTKYLSDGTKVWTELLGTDSYELGSALTTGSDGSIYVSGSSPGDLDGQTNSGKSDTFITKLIVN
ncbi:MAG: Ser-Thr-rich GPI-anchored membrane family protein [Cyanobacteriota bacterium]|nr:Ser-Thr-rich GPI-anchored membrane family protein [Cyanobacteriota bacterium]